MGRNARSRAARWKLLLAGGAAVLTGGASTPDPLFSAPFYADCDVTSQSRARLSGMPWKDSTYRYRLRYLIDPAARSVTSFKGFNAVKGNFDELRHISDVRTATDTMVVFCTDDTYRCGAFDDRKPNGTQVSGHRRTSLIDLRSGAYGTSHRLSIYGNGQSGFEESNVTGSCTFSKA